MSHTLGIRQAQKQKTRQAFLDAALGLSEPELYELALGNLRRMGDMGSVVRGVLAERVLSTVKFMDDHDSARVLLLPGHLQPGEEIVALVPDRDTLTLLTMPADGSGNWSFSDIEKGHPDWLAEKKVRLLLQLGLAKSPNPVLRDVPLVLDVAQNAEQRSIFQVLMGMKTMGRPFFIAPGVPKDRADAIRTAFMKTMSDPAFLAEAEKTLGQIDPLSGPEMQKIITDVHALPADVISKAREAVKAPGA